MARSRCFGTVLVILNVVTAVVFMALMPAEVPMALDSSDVLQRMGSRFENVVWPLVACGSYLAARVVMRDESEEDAEGTARGNLLLQFLLFVAALIVYAFLLSYDPVENTAFVVVSPSSLALFATGGALVLSMNVVPGLLLRSKFAFGTKDDGNRRERVRKRLGLATIFVGWAFVACGLLDDGGVVQGVLYLSMAVWAVLLAVAVATMAFVRR